MDVINYFSPDYQAARAKFLEAAHQAGLTVESHQNPMKGPDGGALFTDVAIWGDPKADRVLLANSATHGAEGFCGSGAMVGWLRSGAWRAVPKNVKVVLVHAINPYGFAWLRRVNEDNVDLNRNFIDHNAGYPENPDYDALHPVIFPESWGSDSLTRMQATFDAYREKHGAFALQKAISQGQYGHADGVFHGGNKPTWSNLTFRRILENHVLGARHVGFIDYHTGLGQYGAADLIASGERGSPELERCFAWYQNGVSSSALGNSTSPALFGVIKTAVVDILADAQVTSMTAEYGTYPVPTVMGAVIADNWVHLRGDLDSPQGKEIKAQTRKAFYPDEDDWKELVYLRSRQIMYRAIQGLTTA